VRGSEQEILFLEKAFFFAYRDVYFTNAVVSITWLIEKIDFTMLKKYSLWSRQTFPR